MTVIARELLGFICAIGIKAEAACKQQMAAWPGPKEQKQKLSKERKTKTEQFMNNIIQIEDRVSRSRSKHEGESSADICNRLNRTRVSSQRQLPTDHDYAVPTRDFEHSFSAMNTRPRCRGL